VRGRARALRGHERRQRIARPPVKRVRQRAGLGASCRRRPRPARRPAVCLSARAARCPERHVCCCSCLRRWRAAGGPGLCLGAGAARQRRQARSTGGCLGRACQAIAPPGRPRAEVRRLAGARRLAVRDQGRSLCVAAGLCSAGVGRRAAACGLARCRRFLKASAWAVRGRFAAAQLCCASRTALHCCMAARPRNSAGSPWLRLARLQACVTRRCVQACVHVRGQERLGQEVLADGAALERRSLQSRQSVLCAFTH